MIGNRSREVGHSKKPCSAKYTTRSPLSGQRKISSSEAPPAAGSGAAPERVSWVGWKSARGKLMR
ncbi:MAG: hypothetical protein Tsb0020_30620 [Haliangiales bacterium]